MRSPRTSRRSPESFSVPAPLYGAITRLEERGLIEPLPSADRRRPYRITAAGASALADAVADMRRIAEVGAVRLGQVSACARDCCNGGRRTGSAPALVSAGLAGPLRRGVRHLHAGQLWIRKAAARSAPVDCGRWDSRTGPTCAGLTGDSVPASDRIRAGVLMVLVSWTAMVIAGSSFAKMSEHFDTALQNDADTHHLPDLAYTFIQTVAGVAGLIVIAAAGLVLPTFLRYLRSGGWPSIRAHALRATGCTLLTAGITAPLLVWAHHLTAHQRNGGSAAYTALFLVWAALVVVTLVLWTVLAVVAARKVTFAPSLLAVEAGMAVAVALAIVGIVTATSLWWALIAERAPTFLSGNPALPVNARLVATVALMALAAATATAGAVRIAQVSTGVAPQLNGPSFVPRAQVRRHRVIPRPSPVCSVLLAHDSRAGTSAYARLIGPLDRSPRHPSARMGAEYRPHGRRSGRPSPDGTV